VGDGESVCRRLHARTVCARRSTLARRTVLRLMDNPVLRPMQMLVRRLAKCASAAGFTSASHTTPALPQVNSPATQLHEPHAPGRCRRGLGAQARGPTESQLRPSQGVESPSDRQNARPQADTVRRLEEGLNVRKQDAEEATMRAVQLGGERG
jgi:hypothetical protein